MPLRVLLPNGDIEFVADAVRWDTTIPFTDGVAGMDPRPNHLRLYGADSDEPMAEFQAWVGVRQ